MLFCRHLKDKKRSKELRKDKKSHHHHKHSSSSVTKTEEEKKAMLEKLRRERTERERQERERVAQIMGRVAAPSTSHVVGDSRRGGSYDDDPRTGYNAGFAQFHGGAVRSRRP